MYRRIAFVALLAWAAGFRCDIQSSPWLLQEDSTTYVVSRDVGSIRYALGRIHIQSFILPAKGRREWSRTEKLSLHLYHTLAFHQWLQRQARRYRIPSISISFSIQDLTGYKTFRKMTAPTIEADNTETWMGQIARLYRIDTPGDFFRQLQKTHKGREVAAILFFTPPQVYSFATRRVGETRDPEWAVVYHQDPYVLVHEFLHLAGADDLYNKRIPPTFCAGDIFQNYSGTPGICSLTAFAIGWIDQLPDADGLTVKDFSSSNDKRRRNGNE